MKHLASWDKLVLPCVECNGHGEVEYEIAKTDWARGGELIGQVLSCETCEGAGELAPLDFEPWDAVMGSLETLDAQLEELADLSLAESPKRCAPGAWQHKLDEIVVSHKEFNRRMSQLLEWKT